MLTLWSLTVPKLSGATEAVIRRWLKPVTNRFDGVDCFYDGEPLAELSTGDVIRAPVAGHLQWCAPVGTTVRLGDEVGHIEGFPVWFFSVPKPTTRPPAGWSPGLVWPVLSEAARAALLRFPDAPPEPPSGLIHIMAPQVGESVTEGSVYWLKQIGDEVRKGEVICEFSTDKVDTEVESPATGMLTRILVAEGADAHPGQLLGEVHTLGGRTGWPLIVTGGKCAKCKGSGTIEVREPCRGCDGSGWWIGSFSHESQRGVRGPIAGPSGDMCPVCHGERLVPTRVPCSDCKGSGDKR